jgi:hypothetical protein
LQIPHLERSTLHRQSHGINRRKRKLVRKKKQLPEEQGLMRIVVELDVVGGAAVRLDYADGVDERRSNRLDRIKGEF